MKLKKQKNNKFFETLKESLEDVLAHTQGKLTLHTDDIEIPKPPMIYGEKEIKKIRKKGNYSQGVFAKILNVSIKTVQSWESGERTPSHAALRLLEIVDKGIYRPEIYKR
jgi:putative transcriptional regulator